MGKRNTKFLWIGAAFLAAFVLWTVLVRSIDVQAIGVNGSSVGFAAMNKIVHETIGVHWLTDIIGGMLLSLGLVALYVFAAGQTGKN